MKIERLAFQRGENMLFYFPEEGVVPSLVTARCYTTCEGVKNFTLKIIEDGIYSFMIPFNCSGKNIVIFYEAGVQKMVLIATVE